MSGLGLAVVIQWLVVIVYSSLASALRVALIPKRDTHSPKPDMHFKFPLLHVIRHLPHFLTSHAAIRHYFTDLAKWLAFSICCASVVLLVADLLWISFFSAPSPVTVTEINNSSGLFGSAAIHSFKEYSKFLWIPAVFAMTSCEVVVRRVRGRITKKRQSTTDMPMSVKEYFPSTPTQPATSVQDEKKSAKDYLKFTQQFLDTHLTSMHEWMAPCFEDLYEANSKLVHTFATELTYDFGPKTVTDFATECFARSNNMSERDSKKWRNSLRYRKGGTTREEAAAIAMVSRVSYVLLRSQLHDFVQDRAKSYRGPDKRSARRKPVREKVQILSDVSRFMNFDRPMMRNKTDDLENFFVQTREFVQPSSTRRIQIGSNKFQATTIHSESHYCIERKKRYRGYAFRAMKVAA